MPQYVTTPDGQRHTFPDEATPEQIKEALSGAYQPVAMTPQNNPIAAMGVSLKDRALRTLPSVGGFAGGLIGAVGGVPGSIAGAAAGGAAGEGLKEALGGEELSPGRIAMGGASEGAYQAAGGLLAKGAGAVARPVMRRALGVGKTIMQGFPDAVETALSRKLSVNAGGVAKAEALRQESSKKLMDILNRSKAAGKTFPTRDITAPVREVAGKPQLPDAERSRIFKQLEDFLEQHGDEMDPVLLKKVKQFYQNRATSVYRAEKTGALTLAQTNRGVFSKALAKGAREQLETIPGVAARESETKSLIGAEKAVRDAFLRPRKPFEIHKPGSYPLVTNANVTSKIAIGLADPTFQSILKQSPRTAAALVMQLIHTDEPDATSGQ